MNPPKYSFPTPNGGLAMSTSPTPNGNMIYATAQWLFLTAHPDPAYYKGLEAFREPRGLSRYSDSIQETSVDDYLAAASDPMEASLLYEASRFGFLYATDISLAQFLARFQGFWQHMKVSALVPVGPLGRAMWALSVVLAAKKPITNQDSWIQSHIMVETAKRRGFKGLLIDLAIKYWWSKKTLPTSDIMASYVGPGCQDHPLIGAWRSYD